MLRVHADDADHAAPVNDLALIANLFDRCPDFHNRLFVSPALLLFGLALGGLFESVNDSASGQVVG